jgi:hypothetical protein
MPPGSRPQLRFGELSSRQHLVLVWSPSTGVSRGLWLRRTASLSTSSCFSFLSDQPRDPTRSQSDGETRMCSSYRIIRAVSNRDISICKGLNDFRGPTGRSQQCGGGGPGVVRADSLAGLVDLQQCAELVRDLLVNVRERGLRYGGGAVVCGGGAAAPVDATKAIARTPIPTALKRQDPAGLRVLMTPSSRGCCALHGRAATRSTSSGCWWLVARVRPFHQA